MADHVGTAFDHMPDVAPALRKGSSARELPLAHDSPLVEEIKPEPPRPLMREVPPADPFPVDTLGTILSPAARAIHDRVQAPIAICGNSVLGAANLSVHGHADVALP
jgi:hypothetical protein